ncbi:GntR family transcriptional regulator [Ruminiclostridium cellobioparum]|uniref:GntR family transcriptional regulator n=1 Tax=Ruminiclostridium cellobioparum TaxID=29355 RepID=UPI0028A64130|nr:GntR family transcriptional regulator [Ruminiclostridium cellobioparum]
MIQLDFKNPKPIYEQIKDKIKELVINGIMKPGDKIPSVRELAQILTINPNTIQKAYKDLETEGFIYSVKGKGNFISQPDSSYEQSRRDDILVQISKLTEELIYLKTPEESFLTMIKNIYRQKEVNKNDRC